MTDLLGDLPGPTCRLTLVAVIIPAYNAERTLRATLSSIQNQTHRNLDIIVVDDGSTDSTATIVRQVAITDPRVRYLFQNNMGQSIARNRGVEFSNATYLCFCDSDDLWHGSKVERQLGLFLANRKLGFVYCGFARITLTDKILSVHERFDEGDIFAKMLRRNLVGNGSSAMFSRTVFEKLGGFNHRYAPAEDLAICLAAAAYYRVGVIPDPLVGYRIWNGSLSSNGMRVYQATKLLIVDFSTANPTLAEAGKLHIRGVLAWQIIRSLQMGKWRLALQLAREDYSLVAGILNTLLPRLRCSSLSKLRQTVVARRKVKGVSFAQYWNDRVGSRYTTSP